MVGIKPTYSRVSRYGVIAYASSLDQVGPFARSVRDAASVLRAVAGADPRDSTCSARPVPDYERALTGEVRGMRIGVPREYFVEGMDAAVEAAVRGSLKQLEAMGASDGRNFAPPHRLRGRRLLSDRDRRGEREPRTL